MRIYEIEDINKFVIILSNIEIEFEYDYNQIILAYTILEKVTGRKSDPFLKSKAQILQDKIKLFIDYEFYPDSDIDLLKKIALEFYNKLATLD